MGSKSTFKPDIRGKILTGFLLQALGLGPSSAELIAQNVIDSVVIKQDGSEKLRIVPSCQVPVDQLLSANDSTLPPSFIDVPLLRNGVKGSAWGTLNIGQMLVEVQTRGTVYSGATFTGIRGRYSYMPVAAEQNRGNVVLQTIIPYTNPVAGWNQWNDVPWYGPISLSKLILQHPAITMVEVYIADRIVHQKTKAASLAALAYYSRYTAPENYAAFPIIFDQLGTPGDFLPLFVGTTRQTVKLRFFWDTTITATPVTFQTYIEGVEADYNQLTPGK